MRSKHASEALHPKLKVPLIEPPRWREIAVLVSQRLHEGLTRADVARALGIDVSAVSRRESGAVPVTQEAIDAYKRALERLLEARAAKEQAQ